MNAPRRPVRIKIRQKRPKPDTSHKLTTGPDGFTRNEWLETLARIKADQPRRYAREVSAGTQVTVEHYLQRKADHERRQPARAAEGRDEREGKTDTGRTAERAARLNHAPAA